ncbi:hypothetical protein J5N97_001931 [Dioscorea zingiberensis]|uniref:Exonuclease 1 n=1 Tax=Dioscorea zingiberensis TaxID=325984 RepID=A0A9D5H1Y9_9LILI|nr:hypothetical protein J5N97_001931 [Dioscorea zingiberensis]
MGIQGLLPLLKSIMEPIHIKDLKGSCVAIDTYSWLHKGALSCSRDLCKGIPPTSRHIDYCMHRVNLLRHYGVKPILVFDGGLLPMKGEQENKRARARKENFARAIEHDSNGNSSAAYECYQKAVDISPSIALELIQVLKRENVSYVVAPYEADAQMTFLAVSKQVEAVITEDSDLIPFGCPRIIYKMDKFGQGVEFQYSRLPRNKDLSFAGFTKQMVLEMCILSGCDYLQSLPGMGLKRAHALIKKFTSYDKQRLQACKYAYRICALKVYCSMMHDVIVRRVKSHDTHTHNISQYSYNNCYSSGSYVAFLTAICLVQVTEIFLNNSKGFASLEAKRKFRAPRSSPDDPSPISSSSLSPDENTSVDDALVKPTSQVEDGFPTDLSESPNDDMAGKTRSPENTLLQQPRHYIPKPCVTLHRERECKNAPDTVEGDPESAPFGNSHFPRKLVKRKNSPNDSVQEDNGKPKQMCTNASLPDNGPSASSHEATFKDTKTEEGRFGSNISHLGRYSDIAEKSMENFVSVISSFRFGSSGSRASGLRAPLKDVRNTCTNRTTVGADFSQFEYVPNNQKDKNNISKTKNLDSSKTNFGVHEVLVNQERCHELNITVFFLFLLYKKLNELDCLCNSSSVVSTL